MSKKIRPLDDQFRKLCGHDKHYWAVDLYGLSGSWVGTSFYATELEALDDASTMQEYETAAVLR